MRFASAFGDMHMFVVSAAPYHHSLLLLLLYIEHTIPLS